MDREAFEREVQAAARLLPEQFASALQNLEILVEDAPGPEVVAEFGGNLLGLYQGVPLPERSATYPPLYPDRIVLYQRNIEAAGHTPAGIREEVRLTLLHEIGHYFGMDDDHLHEMGY